MLSLLPFVQPWKCVGYAIIICKAIIIATWSQSWSLWAITQWYCLLAHRPAITSNIVDWHAGCTAVVQRNSGAPTTSTATAWVGRALPTSPNPTRYQVYDIVYIPSVLRRHSCLPRWFNYISRPRCLVPEWYNTKHDNDDHMIMKSKKSVLSLCITHYAGIRLVHIDQNYLNRELYDRYIVKSWVKAQFNASRRRKKELKSSLVVQGTNRIGAGGEEPAMWPRIWVTTTTIV